MTQREARLKAYAAASALVSQAADTEVFAGGGYTDAEVELLVQSLLAVADELVAWSNPKRSP